MNQRIILLLVILLLAVPASAAGGGLRHATLQSKALQHSPAVEQQTVVHDTVPQSSRNLEALALYGLPKLQVEMETEWTDELLKAKRDAEQSGNFPLLSQTGRQDSALSYPLRSATQDYLYKGFLERVEKMAAEVYNGQQQHSGAPQEDGVGSSSSSTLWHDMYNDLHTVDIQVQMYLYQLDDPARVSLLAHLTPTVAFVEPLDASTKPSNAQVQQLFGIEWTLDDLLGQNLDDYQQTLSTHATSSTWMQRISYMNVYLLAAVNSSPGSTSGWSDALQRFMISLLILLGVGALVVGLLAVNHRRRQKHYERQLSELYLDEGGGGDNDFRDEYSHNGGGNSYSDNPNTRQYPLQLSASQDDGSFVSASTGASKRPPPINTRGSSLDSARHGADVFHRSPQMNAMSALEASDRYLSKHRPDLVNSAESDFSIFGRSYQIPSNPFEWLYKASNDNAAGHFPGYPAAFTPSSSNDPVSRHSFTTPSPSGGASTPTSAFTPVHSQPNLAARYMDSTDGSGHGHHVAGGSAERRTSATKHTGGGWHEHDEDRSQASSVVGSIFRNLSMNSWVSGGQQHAREYPTATDFAHQDPMLGHVDGDIELEELQDDDEDYNFAFKDFPRVDGTPCLIYKDNEDELKERERKRIFVVDDAMDDSSSHTDTETKQDDANAKPVSDRAFMRMLSDNSLAIDEDDLNAGDDDNDELMLGLPNHAQEEETSAKSPRFQQQLARLLETKQRRYAMEQKKEDIVKGQRQKRKQLREQQRVDRHKAMERDLEEIEAEFLSPLARDMQAKQQQQSQLAPPRSPVPPHQRTRSRGGSGNWNVLSPGKGNKSPVPPSRQGHERVKSVGAASPFRKHFHKRNGSFSNAIGGPSPRNNSRSSSHQRSGSMGGGGISRSASHDVSDQGMVDPLNSSQHGRLNMRPVNMYGQQLFEQSGTAVDLSQPDLSSMPPSMQGNQKYPSPQAVVDEILQQPAQSQQRRPHTFNHRRTRTPTKQGIQPSGGSFDVVDFGHNAFASTNRSSPLKRSSSHRRSQSSSMSWVSGNGSVSSNASSRHGRSNSQHSLGGQRHRRSSSQSSQHRRSNSSSEDVFLHGVVAQTRFV